MSSFSCDGADGDDDAKQARDSEGSARDGETVQAASERAAESEEPADGERSSKEVALLARCQELEQEAAAATQKVREYRGHEREDGVGFVVLIVVVECCTRWRGQAYLHMFPSIRGRRLLSM